MSSGMTMLHEKDPKQVLLEQLKNIDGFVVYNNMVLVAVYKRPERTKSGVYLTQTQQKEDEYQGKAALIIKAGPKAFENDGTWFTEGAPAIGDWIAIRPSDGWPLLVNGVLCRMLKDEAVKVKIPSPDSVY